MAWLTDLISYAAARTGMSIAGMVGPVASDRIGAFLGSVAHRLVKSRREVARDNLRKALGDELTDSQIDLITKDVFRNVGRTLLEIGGFGAMLKEDVLMVVHDDMLYKNLDEVRSHGKGGIFITAHYGNWELLGQWIAASGFNIKFVVAVQHNRRIDALITKIRESSGAGVIPNEPRKLREVFRALKDNYLVAIVPDQHAPSQRLVLDFFGRRAAVATGAAMFSLKTGAPLVCGLLRRVRCNSHRTVAGPIIYPPAGGTTEKNIVSITQSYMRFIEDSIRAHPDQWMWTHRRWKID